GQRVNAETEAAAAEVIRQELERHGVPKAEIDAFIAENPEAVTEVRGQLGAAGGAETRGVGEGEAGAVVTAPDLGPNDKLVRITKEEAEALGRPELEGGMR